MPLSSSVIKANQVQVNGSVYRLQFCGAPERAVQQDGVIKETTEQSSSPEPDPRLLDEARTQAAEIRAAAENARDQLMAAAVQEREELLHQAAVMAESLQEEAKKSGYDSGYLEGLAEGRQEGTRLRREAEEYYAETLRLRDEMLARVEPQVVELAVSIAEKIVGTQLDGHPETIVPIVREALRQLKESGEIMVRLHPDDLPICKMHLTELQAEVREKSTLNLFADPELLRGHCRVETSSAVVECLLDERFQSLRKLLADVKNHE